MMFKNFIWKIPKHRDTISLWATCSNIWQWWRKCFHIASFSFPYGNLCLLPLVILLCHGAHYWPATSFLFTRILGSFASKPLSSQQGPVSPGVWWYSIPHVGVCVCHWTAWGPSQPISSSLSGSLWIAALPSSVSATAPVVLSTRLLEVHCVLAFGSLIKTNSIGPSIAPIISPWGMPVVTRCQVGPDSADHNDALSWMVQPGFHPSDCLCTHTIPKWPIQLLQESVLNTLLKSRWTTLLALWAPKQSSH